MADKLSTEQSKSHRRHSGLSYRDSERIRLFYSKLAFRFFLVAGFLVASCIHDKFSNSVDKQRVPVRRDSSEIADLSLLELEFSSEVKSVFFYKDARERKL